MIPLVLGGGSDATPEQIEGQRFSPSIPRALEATPLWAGWFTEKEATVGVAPVVVISYRLWKRRFGERRHLWKTVQMDGEAATTSALCRMVGCCSTIPHNFGRLARLETRIPEAIFSVAAR